MRDDILSAVFATKWNLREAYLTLRDIKEITPEYGAFPFLLSKIDHALNNLTAAYKRVDLEAYNNDQEELPRITMISKYENEMVSKNDQKG